MKCYTIAELDVTDRAWVRDYVANVTKLVEEGGGRYLARTGQVEKLEGDRPLPQVTVIVEWPTREAAIAFYESDAYRPYREQRLAGARNQLVLVAGEDMTGAARVG